MISICLISWNRKKELIKSLDHNLANHGYEGNLELLFADQGSHETGLKKYLKSKNPAYFRENTCNEGVARTFNQLMLRARGDFIVLLGNDILMPDGWLNEMFNYANHMFNICGIVGVGCTVDMPPLKNKYGVNAHFIEEKNSGVYGTWMLPKHLLKNVGYFDERFHPYGLEDSDYAYRVNHLGYQSLYVPKMKSSHICNDAGEKSDYRSMKDASLRANHKFFEKKITEYHKDENLFFWAKKKNPI